MNEKTKDILKNIGKVVSGIISVLAILICFSIKWMLETWANLTMDELVYHLNSPLEGTNSDMIWQYVFKCIVPTIIIIMVITAIMIIFKKKKKRTGYICIVVLIASVTILVLYGYTAWKKLDIGDYMSGQSEISSFIDDNYVDPKEVTLTFPEKKRNLIYIFLESMETAYSDEDNGGAFEKDVIPELTEIAQENEEFSGKDNKLNGGYSMPGTTWTMGAMFAQTSGLPLKISISANEMDTQDNFFPGITTIGDILSDAGYSQTLLLGSNATFGGRKLYFSEHGNYDIIDYNYAMEQGWLSTEEYPVWWGYDDQKLFEFAKNRLGELATQNEPFNLTMLTVDTHFEDGYVCDKCDDRFGNNQYANVMACSSKQVAEFVEWVQQQDFYENTTIVISGDHPTMDSDFCEDVDESYIRKVYTAYINGGKSELSNARNYTTMDAFPTTLAAIGVEIEGNRLGLGTNLFSSEQTLTERFGIEKEEKELNKQSELMTQLADIDESSEVLLVREGKIPTGEVVIGEYQRQTGTIPLTVQQITGGENIQSILVAVWTNDDQSDLQWIELQMNEDSNYTTEINMGNFGFIPGDYNIHVYAITGDGEQYFMGGGLEHVE
ncbi:GBS Bsp-like repeat-containing protein [Dorea sp. AM58-8]|uniref:GBS Bsp-like repeat-containing protein n=1 Tax=Dorea sp. AM58-8 TaxID=2292346 RepID=UPI001FA8B45E|nr:GBS Bsp-like repeat-containing protein [Dorea sp. AM58-8]